jgi:PAS domain S-box-containing protein
MKSLTNGGTPALPSSAILDASPYPQAAYDLNFHVWAVNRRHCAMTGMAAEDVVGRNLFDAFPANPGDPASDAQPALAASLARMVETGEPDVMPLVKHDLTDGDGRFEEYYWQITNSPIWSNGDGTGEIIGALQTSRDVTAEVVRQKINAAQRRTAMIGGQLMFFKVDFGSDHVESSAELQELFGYEPTPEGLLLQVFFDRIHEDDRPAVVETVDRLRAEQIGAQSRVDYRIVRPDGQTRWLSSRMETVAGPPNAAPVLTGVTLDVTDLRQSEADLRAAVGERDLLIAEVHHRVKNSLQLVTSVLNLEAAAAAGSDAADRLRRASDRVQAIASVHGVLYQSEDVRAVDLGAFLETLVQHIAASVGGEEQGIEAATRIEERPVRIATDRAISLSLAVNELVTNAFKHAFPDGAGGKVEVSLARDHEGRIAVTVADDGIGRGTSAASPPFDRPTNAGLGSKLVRSLAQQIEATLSHDDTGDSHGVTLTFDA